MHTVLKVDVQQYAMVLFTLRQHAANQGQSNAEFLHEFVGYLRKDSLENVWALKLSELNDGLVATGIPVEALTLEELTALSEIARAFADIMQRIVAAETSRTKPSLGDSDAS